MTLLEITTYGRNTLRRLRQEARLVVATPGPNLARACELDRWSPTATLVTEYVPDISLEHLVAISPLPAAAALHALQDVAATLDAMHECGLVHGHLRPANVFVLPDGRAALAQPEDLPPATGTSTERGRRQDARDFAMLAFELFTGDHPRDARTAIAKVTSLPVLPRQAALELKRALTATPAQRPRPVDLVAALDAIPPEDWPTNHLGHVPAPPAAPPPAPTPPVERAEPADTGRWAPPEVAEAPEAPDAPEVEEPAEGALVSRLAALAPQPTAALAPQPAAAPAVEAVVRRPAPRVVVRIVPPRRRKRRLRRIFEMFVILLGLATVLSGGGVGAWLLFVAPTASAGDPGAEPPVVRRIALGVTPPQAQCPRASFHLTAMIVTDGGPGDVELRWRLPNGMTAETQRFTVDGGRGTLHTALDLTLAGRQRVVGDVVAVVSPGGIRATIPLRYLCPTGNKQAADSRSA